MPKPDLYRPEAFAMPPGIYMDGNSLGLMPHAAKRAVESRLADWAELAVVGWDRWFGLSEALSPALSRLVGARPEEVIATGSITTNLHLLLPTFYRPQGQRRHLLATELDFPTDLYAMRSWADLNGAELRLIPSRDGHTLHPDDIAAAITGEIALVLLPTVLYRSGQLLDVARWTAHAHAQGCVVGWDAAHSIGAVPHQFHDWDADFAVWCSYKYLNAGPGAPGGLFVHERHLGTVPALRGWWGNDKASQFKMANDYERGEGAGAYQLGTPPILSLAALEGALEVYDGVDLAQLRARSLELTGLLLTLADEQLPEMQVITPRAEAERGGHISLQWEHNRQVSLALRARGIVPDYREPGILRLAPIPFYNSEADVRGTVQAIREIIDSGEYRTVGGGSAVS
ncbi:kynureninase [Deinococcus piscis]|uniref:Kynureninase n=1 Tax=Deinococcus piscis TaxID=394230 RepID=A0ABQ3JWY0_9DEIO|nr:kynureninase [Deinococcus piscis]GHF93851.1 kynureninase [Deinococcus piscis]